MKRWRKLLRLLLLSGLVAGVLALVALASLPHLLERSIERGLSSFFQRPVSVGGVRVAGFVPLTIEVLDLRVGGATAGAPPFLVAPRIVAVPSLAPLRGRVLVLNRLRLDGPQIGIRAFPEGGDDIPRFGGGGSGGFELRVNRLVIEKGIFRLDHQRVPLELDLPDFHGRLSAQGRGVLAGGLSFGPGRLQFGANPEMRLGTDLELRLVGSQLQVVGAHLRAVGTDLAYEGEIALARRPQGTLTLHGRVDLALLDQHVMRTGLAIQGQGRFSGSVGIDGSRLRVRGRLEGEGGSFDGQGVERFAGEVSWDERGVILKDLGLRALGGDGVLQVVVPPGRSTARLQARLERTDAEALVRWIFALGPAGLGSSATGELELHWPRGRFRDELSGRAALDLVERGDARKPLSGRLEWRAERGVHFIERADLQTPETSARIAGRIGRDQSAELQLDAASRDLAGTDELLRRVRRALGSPDAQRAGLSGRGRFSGRWHGTLRDPIYDGRFDAADVGYLGVRWGELEWRGTLTPLELRSDSLLLRKRGAELRLAGRVALGDYGGADALDLRVGFEGWPSRDLTRALGFRLDLEAPLSGEAVVAGRRSLPRGSATLRGGAGLYYGIPFDAFELGSRFADGLTSVSDGHVRLGGGSLSFRGSLSGDGIYDGRAELRAVELSELAARQPAQLRPGGRLSGELTLVGPLDRPRLQARLGSPRLFLGDEGVGALEAGLVGRGDGQLAVSASCRSPRVELTLAGVLGLDPEYRSRLRLVARETSLDPFLRAALPALPAAVQIVASGALDLEGPLLQPRELSLVASMSALELLLPEYPVRNVGPLRLAVSEGRLRVLELRLAGEGTDLAVRGQAALLGDGPLDLEVSGAADLRALSVVTRRVRGRGAARLTFSVAGRRDEPRLEGRLDLEGGGLRMRGFPQGLEDVRGSVRFDLEKAVLDGVRGRLGGGALDVDGQVAYAGGVLSSLDLHATGRGVLLRYPEGLRSLLDGDLRLFGDGTRQWLSGDVEVRQATWRRRYDLASELMAAARVAPEAAASGHGLRLDVRLRAPGTLELDNNLGTLHASADLRLSGPIEGPSVLGRAEVDRGRIYFQGTTYTIRRGSIDFQNPQRIDPLFDIEAEARVRAYRVTLRANGTLERVYPTLSSDPPLGAVQILNLLAGADETAVASLTQSQADQARLAATGAATLAAGRISEEVGLERQAEKLFGLNRFSIDPALGKSSFTNPTARLTIGKRITPDLSVLYSTDLGGTQERVLTIEYTLSDRLSLLFTQVEPDGGVGFDVRVRQSR